MGSSLSFEEQEARWQEDWNWLVHCPPLVSGSPLPEGILRGWERPLVDLAPLRAFFDPESSPRARNRVGFYAETLVSSALSSLEGVTELRHSIPVREEKRTLGELDFVFRYRGRLIHLEIALKFYLHSATVPRLGSHYIGPHAGDTLERKSEKLLGHQLPLGRRAIPDLDDSFLFCPGILFYHPGDPPPADSPEFLSASHRRGLWMRSNEFRNRILAERRFSRGSILTKPFWLADRSDDPVETVVDQVDRHFRSSDQPLHLSLEDEDSEPTRCFVVDPEWPHRKS